MKKVLFTLTLAGLALFGSSNKAVAQVEQGNILIDLYYGFPNSSKSLYKTFDENEGFEAKGFGPLGIRGSYMVADNFGVGVEVNYVAGGAIYTETETVTNPNTLATTTEEYSIEREVTKLRLMARLDYHFVQTSVVDAYVGFGAGYKAKNTTWTTNEPGGIVEELEGGFLEGAFPVAMRVAVGTRFFFTDNIGINVELGLGGGPLLGGGLSLKF